MDIWQETLKAEDYVIRCRRHIHENPELSDREENTVAFILQELTAMGIRCENVPGGGVMGFISGAQPGKTVLLRADIDALPMQEDAKNEIQSKVCVSKVPGVAHTCGHDAHTAMLLGAARLLQDHREEIAGNIVLYFERGEEGGHGDYYMVKYLQDNRIPVDSCWAQHVRPALATGTIAVLSGAVYAGNTSYHAAIRGENALSCGIAIINSLNTARMREISPFERVTLSTNKLQYEPEGICRIGGTCRYYDLDKAGRPMRDTIHRCITETVAAYGCTTEKPVEKGGMSRGVYNHPVCCGIAQKALGAVIGKENIVDYEPTMGAESFSILSAYYPSIIAFTGTGNPDKGMTAAIHNPKFEPDEAAFKTGVAATVAYALGFLTYEKPIDFAPFAGTIDEYLEANRR